MSVDTIGPGGLNYFPCRYAHSKLSFRGPRRSLSEPFVAFLGGTNTYGKFVERPFPDLLENGREIACVNFGCTNAGVDAIASDPGLLRVSNAALVTVLQILSPRNTSNGYYSVHPRRNDRFVRPSNKLQALYDDVDFSDFNFTKHMLRHLHQVCPSRFSNVVDELQKNWTVRMAELIDQIPGPCVLLWFSDHQPGQPNDRFGLDPWFVTPEMIEAIRPEAAAYVEVVASLDALAAGTEGMIFSELEAPAAQQVLGPLAHVEAAEALSPLLSELTMQEAHRLGRAS